MATKNIKGSRLKETAFSRYNLRDAYISDIASYISDLRDEAIFSNYGIKVLVRVPANDEFDVIDNNVDEYSNHVNTNWIETVETVVPNFSEYREILSEDGMTADGTDGVYPLEVNIPSKLHLPRDSRIIFNEYDCNENKIAREWVVLGTQMKQLSGSKAYTRIAQCVPARKESYINIHTDLSIFWFDCFCDKFNKYKDIRAHGEFWFIHNIIEKDKVHVVVLDGDYWETPISNPEYNESLNSVICFDTRPKTILNGGYAFIAGETYVLKYPNGDIIYVKDPDTEITQPLVLTVESVNENGSILSYSLNVNYSYSIFNEDNYIDIEIYYTERAKAKIRLTGSYLSESPIQETIYQTDMVISNPKIIIPYQVDAKFSAKSTSISVLN